MKVGEKHSLTFNLLSFCILSILTTHSILGQNHIEGRYELVRRYATESYSVDYSNLPFKYIWIFYRDGNVMMDRIESGNIQQDGALRKQSDGGLTYKVLSEKLEVYQNGKLFAVLKQIGSVNIKANENAYVPWIEKKHAYISLNAENEEVNNWVEMAMDLKQNFVQDFVLKPINDLIKSYAGKVFAGSLGLLINIIDEAAPVGGILDPKNDFLLISDGNWVRYNYDAVPDGYTNAFRLSEGESFVFLGYSLPAGDYSSYVPKLHGYATEIAIEKLISFDLRKGKQLYRTIPVFEDQEIKEQRGPYLVLYKQKISLPIGLYILRWGNSKKFIMVK